MAWAIHLITLFLILFKVQSMLHANVWRTFEGNSIRSQEVVLYEALQGLNTVFKVLGCEWPPDYKPYQFFQSNALPLVAPQLLPKLEFLLFLDVSQRLFGSGKETANPLRRTLRTSRCHPENRQRGLGREHLGAEAHGEISKQFWTNCIFVNLLEFQSNSSLPT